MTETYILFALATLSLAVAPGPDNIFVLTQSVARGTRYGIAIASGLISGCIVHTSIVALGFGAVIKNNDWLLYGIKIAGAIYLIYLAWQVYSAPSEITFSASGPQARNLRSSYIKGVTMNLLNPKVTLFFLALLPQFLQPIPLADWIQIYILGGIFMIVSLIVFYGIAFLAGRISQFLQRASWFGIFIKWLQILVFVGIAVAILLP